MVYSHWTAVSARKALLADVWQMTVQLMLHLLKRRELV